MSYIFKKKLISRVLCISVFSILFGTSCVPTSRLSYVQSPAGTNLADMQYTGPQTDNIIRSGDELYVRITSADEERTAVMYQDQNRIHDPTLLSHTVSEDGTIKLPYVGRIAVGDLTLEEASDFIETLMSDYLFVPSVYIRFVNTKVTVLGEVRNPGVFVFNYKNINILQAVAYANDITEFGDRRNVLIIREEDGMRRTKNYVDLTSDALLESEWYTIKSDDVIYVEPLGRKKWGMATVPYNLILSAITTALVISTYIGR